MFRSHLGVTLSAVLFLAAAAGAQSVGDDRSTPSFQPQAATSAAAEAPAPAACNAPTVQEPDDPRWRWRLRAYNHLDCVTAIVDEALRGVDARPSGTRADDEGNQHVTISRAELERIRMLALWARDAAARIGQ